MKGSNVLLIFAILSMLSVVSSTARIKRGLYALAHNYGGMPMASAVSYTVSPYQSMYQSQYYSPYRSSYQSPYHSYSPQLMQAASYSSPVVHSAPVTGYVAMPRYIGVPIARYYDPWSQSHRLPATKYYASPTTYWRMKIKKAPRDSDR